MDLWGASTQDDSRSIAGLYLGAGQITGNAQGVYGGDAGTARMDGLSVGAYWTHTNSRGWYVSTAAQGTHFGKADTASVLGQTLESNGWALSGTIEGGYPIPLADGWTFVPQAQLVVQQISLGDAGDEFGLVHYADSTAVYSRFGGRLGKAWRTQDGTAITAWGRANIWHSFGAQATTTFSNLQNRSPLNLKTDLIGDWGQVGVGVEGQVGANVTISAAGDYNFALDQSKSSSLSGRVGLRVTW